MLDEKIEKLVKEGYTEAQAIFIEWYNISKIYKELLTLFRLRLVYEETSEETQTRTEVLSLIGKKVDTLSGYFYFWERLPPGIEKSRAWRSTKMKIKTFVNIRWIFVRLHPGTREEFQVWVFAKEKAKTPEEREWADKNKPGGIPEKCKVLKFPWKRRFRVVK